MSQLIWSHAWRCTTRLWIHVCDASKYSLLHSKVYKYLPLVEQILCLLVWEYINIFLVMCEYVCECYVRVCVCLHVSNVRRDPSHAAKCRETDLVGLTHFSPCSCCLCVFVHSHLCVCVCVWQCITRLVHEIVYRLSTRWSFCDPGVLVGRSADCCSLMRDRI